MNKDNLKLSFNCKSDETQNHIFEQCIPIIEKMEVPKYVELKNLFLYRATFEPFLYANLITCCKPNITCWHRKRPTSQKLTIFANRC